MVKKRPPLIYSRALRDRTVACIRFATKRLVSDGKSRWSLMINNKDPREREGEGVLYEKMKSLIFLCTCTNLFLSVLIDIRSRRSLSD